MTDEPKCVGCPFRRDCPGCPWKGGTVATQHVSAGQAGRIGVAKTNGPGLSPETVLATPIRLDEQEDCQTW